MIGKSVIKLLLEPNIKMSNNKEEKRSQIFHIFYNKSLSRINGEEGMYEAITTFSQIIST